MRTSSSKNEKDTHDIVLYYQREMEMKDDIIARLNEELAKRETQLKFEIEKIRKNMESDIYEIQTSNNLLIDELKQKLQESERELSLVDSYRRDKDIHNETLAELKQSKEELEKDMIQALDRQERKFLEEKAQLYKNLDSEKILFKEVAMREAKEAMGHEVNMVFRENERIHEEIKFHRQMADELIKEKKEADNALIYTKREIEILKENEKEYLKQGLVRAKEIKTLRERVEHLEKQQIVNVERFRARTKELQTSVYKELEDATLDAAGLRRLLKIKNKELRTMKTLSATILSQRNEIEQFFLEALHEVKEKIKVEKKFTKSAQSSKLNSNTVPVFGSSGALPHIKGVNPKYLDPRATSNLPTSEVEQIFIRNLSWEDKELVIRVLFAKINGQQNMVDNAITQSKISRAKTPDSPSKPVFLSEGTNLTQEEANIYQKNYEVIKYGEEDEDDYDYDYNEDNYDDV